MFPLCNLEMKRTTSIVSIINSVINVEIHRCIVTRIICTINMNDLPPILSNTDKLKFLTYYGAQTVISCPGRVE